MRKYWWACVKGMIRKYPELQQKKIDLQSTSVSPNLSGMPSGKGSVSNPVADAALRDLAGNDLREYEAVYNAIKKTQQMKTGYERIKLVKLMFWNEQKINLNDAADFMHISWQTARNWHGEFITAVANFYGFF